MMTNWERWLMDHMHLVIGMAFGLLLLASFDEWQHLETNQKLNATTSQIQQDHEHIVRMKFWAVVSIIGILLDFFHWFKFSP